MTAAANDALGPRPELVVVAHPGAVLQVHGTRVQGADAAAAPLEQALVETRAHARPLFGPSEERVRARRRESPWDLPDLSHYYHVSVEADHEAVAARLNEEESVAGAYVKAPVRIDEEVLPASALPDVDAPMDAVSPDFGGRQGHLDAAPGGVNARTAWEQPGGDGTAVQVVVVGGAWRLTHEDLVGNVGGIIGGQPIDAVSFRNHGTAVLGLVRAARNDRGVTGVAPACQIRQVATFGLGTAAAIRVAADALGAGGIILIEWQRPGPGATGVGSAGFLPLEWWPDDFAAISYATAKGVIVVEPAGNGSVSLDDARYNTPASGFPATWKNPFHRDQADCGAILVGAGAPPPGTHGNNNLGPDRSRLPTSNVGASLDAQGWGAELTTLGYGDLQGGPTEDVWYTDRFGGTSGAAALVAGVAASLQGMQLAGAKRPPLTPADMRLLLRQSGSPQQDRPEAPADSHRIGSRPDLLALMALLVATKDESKDSKDSKDGKDSKDSKDFKDDKEAPDKLEKDNKDNADNKQDKEDKDDKDHGPDKIVAAPIEKQPDLPEPDQPAAQASVVSDESVRHFISDALRPEIAATYLAHEPDFRGRDPAELAAELRPPAGTSSGV
jgi:subtilase family protein